MIRVTDPATLDRDALEAVVRDVQELMYQELDQQDQPVWNPEKEWSADHLDLIADILGQHDLQPRNDAGEAS
jgi:hypothetical protein